MSHQAVDVAFRADAPEGERTEALSELQKSHMPTTSDLLPSDTVRQIMDVAVLHLEEGEEMAKAVSDHKVPFPSRAARLKKPGMQSVIHDEWSLDLQGWYWERPGLTFDQMRTMVQQTPVLNAVIMTRSRQVQRFCRVAEKGHDAPGFEIKHVDRGHQITKSEQESIMLLNRFISNCGWQFKPRLRKRLNRDSFSQFMAQSVRDSLIMDAAPIELEWKRNMKLGIDGFYAVDGATIRLTPEDGFNGDDDVFALQVVEGNVCTAYTRDDLVYEARNPRTDVDGAGYGVSETELLVRIVTGYINAMTYNIKGFDSNSIPKGMLHLTGNYSDNDLKAFKRYWNSMVRGINNAHALPVMVSKDQESRAQFERFGVEYDEMAFAKWMTFLTSIICAIYGMSPAEINFDSFSGGNSSPLSGSDTSERLAASKDSGLRPLLAYYENTLTDFIVSEFSDDFVFRWTGLDPEDKQNKQEMRKLTLTVNEARAEENKPAMEGPLGDAPLNPSLVGPWMQINGIGQPAPGEGSPGAATSGGAGADTAAEDPDGDEEEENDDGQLPEEGGDASDFGATRDADFGKSFGLPPVFKPEDLLA
ncbi:phage portal protein [Burkholderia anthina]|uniref:phage portal protein n=1 Tax=Burkholderia anthina TaxID=179879 RepID=UPI00158BBF42|nr:phage portal protein [Burkholderia anthina]